MEGRTADSGGSITTTEGLGPDTQKPAEGAGF